jgi:choline dehydrogenase-like flavoprotein
MNMGKVEKNGGKKGRFLQEGAVHGVEGLCVADASILPAVIATNLHLTCVMIGEKLADSLLRRRDDTAAAAAARL